MSRVIHFEIHAEDPERAVKFYKSGFGWEFTKWGGTWDYWLIKTGTDSQPGIDGGLLRRRGPGPVAMQAVSSYVCTISTESVDESLKTVTASGGTIALPKMPIPGVGWLAYATDTEGNIFGVMHSDPSAK